MTLNRRPSLHEVLMLAICCALCVAIFLKVVVIEGDEAWMRWVSETVDTIRRTLR